MTTRPRLDSLWASKDISQIADPDLDSNHPSGEGGVGKYIKGWISEREPHQWANYLYRRYDDVALEYAERGFSLYRAELKYSKGSIVWASNGKNYVALKDTSADPTVSADWGLTLVSLGEAQVRQQMATMEALLASHRLRKDNPHGVSLNQLNVYSKLEIDAMGIAFADALAGHTASQANPHAITHTQLGTLTVQAGGAFTGKISFTQPAWFGASRVVASQEDRLQFGAFGKAMSLTTEDAMYGEYSKTPTMYICHSGNWHKVRMRAEREFAVPMPDITIPLVNNLSTPSVGNYLINCSHTPVFNAQGLSTSNDMTVTVSRMEGMKTLSVYKNGQLKIYENFSGNNLVSIIGVGSWRDVQMWATILTDKQKSMLGRHWRR